jgi:hypothetical protein
MALSIRPHLRRSQGNGLAWSQEDPTSGPTPGSRPERGVAVGRDFGSCMPSCRAFLAAVLSPRMVRHQARGNGDDGPSETCRPSTKMSAVRGRLERASGGQTEAIDPKRTLRPLSSQLSHAGVRISSGAQRPMKMGTIASPWRYDATACSALKSASPRWFAILSYGSRAAVFPTSRIVRLPFDSGLLDQISKTTRRANPDVAEGRKFGWFLMLYLQLPFAKPDSEPN